MISKKLLFLPAVIFSLFVLSSCYQVSKKCCGKKQSWFKKSKSCCLTKYSVAGQANVKGINNKSIQGEVFFERTGKGEVEISANFKGLAPNKKFGFHVHEFGDCENKALRAGGHFNPWKKKHGGPEDQEKHLGDLGNIHSDDKGQASYSSIIEGKVKKFLGRSVIVHALPDDFTSQPTGKSGDRIACGVIVASMPSVPTKESSSDKKEKVQKAGDASQKVPAAKTVVPKNIKGSVQKASSVKTSAPKDTEDPKKPPSETDAPKDVKDSKKEVPAKVTAPKDVKDSKKEVPVKATTPKDTGNSPK